MMFFAAAQAGSSSSAVQTAVSHSAQEYNYSIRFFFNWHQQAIRNAICWSGQNGGALLAGIAWLVITIFLCAVFFLLLRKIVIPRLGEKNKNIAEGIKAISVPVVWLLFWLGFSFSIDFIPFAAEAHKLLDKVFYVCFVLSLLSIFQHALQYVASLMIIQFKQKNPENFNMNKLLLDLSLSIIRLALWLFVIIFILQEVFHFRVTHLIASAGIFGLAIAFAAKDTIANIFGAFSILGGKIFKVGDAIKVGSAEGVVDQIGIRSIRIRAFNDGRVIDIPNHIIADSQIENYSTRHYWKEHFCFGLVYQTTPEQMLLAKKILCDIGNDLAYLLQEGKAVQFDFLLFDQSSLNIEGDVWFRKSDVFAMRRARGLFNEEVLKRFNAAGLEMAYPSTTVFLENSATK